jgi:hypothetical protein
MTASFERQVFDNLKSIMATGLPWQKYVEFERIKHAISDFNDTELPAVQFWFDEEPFMMQKQRGHAQADLRIIIELVLKSTAKTPLTQGDLLDYLRDIRELLGENLQLDIQGQMFQVTPVRAVRDLVTQLPYMVGQLQINVQGQVPYGTC